MSQYHEQWRKLRYHQQIVLQLMKDYDLDHLYILERRVVLKQILEVHQLVLVTKKIPDHSKEHVDIYHLKNSQ